MGIISIKCVITRVSDSRAPGSLEKRAPLLPAEARSRVLSMPVNAPFNATILLLKSRPTEIWDGAVGTISFFHFSLLFLDGSDFFQRSKARINCQEAEKEALDESYSTLFLVSRKEQLKGLNSFSLLSQGSKTNQILVADINARGWDPSHGKVSARDDSIV